MFDPWKIVAAHPWLAVVHQDMPDHKPGATDGHSTIWLSDRLSQRERRCVLTHELVHLQHGHSDCQPRAIEMQVRMETATLLIPWDRLIREVPACASVNTLAEDLGVTDLVLMDRLQGLSPERLELLRPHDASV